MLRKTSRNRLQSKKMLWVMIFIGVVFTISLISAVTWWVGTAPTHYYKLNEAGASDDATDAIGTTNLAVTGTCAVHTGKLNNARACDAAGNYLSGTTGGAWNFGTGIFTIAFWFNISDPTTAVGTAVHNFGGGNWAAANKWVIYVNGDGNGKVGYTSSGTNIFEYDGSYDDARWHRVVLVRTGTGVGETILYVDGSQVATGTDAGDLNEVGTLVLMDGATGYSNGIRGNGPIDDLQIFKGTAWGAGDVVEDWNGGAGKEADSSTVLGLTTTLLNPQEGNTTKITDMAFTANVTPISGNVTNATLFVWHSNMTLFGKNVTVISGNVTNTSFASISGLVNGNYAWNFWGCVKNDTGSLCKFATANRTFTKTAFTIVSQSFTESVFETSRQNYELNITTVSGLLSVSSKLIYNGTNYSATSNCVGTACNIKSYLDVPLIPSGSQQNKTFWWEITIYDGSSSSSFDTTNAKKDQNVTAINLTHCGAAPYDTKALNFTSFLESNRTRIDSFNFEGTFDFWLGGGTIKKRYAYANTTANEVNFCILPNQTFYVDSEIKYDFEDENTTLTARNHYYQNVSLAATLNHVELFLLNAEDSTSFILQVLDNNAGIANALINIQRFYPSVGLWKTVQIAKTDSNGESVGFYEVESVDYRHFIYGSDGSLLLQTPSQKVVGKSVPYTLTFDVGSTPVTPWAGFLNQTNYTTSIVWNSTNKMVTFSYVDLSDAVLRGRLLVEQIRASNASLLVCNLSRIQPSASINCNLSAYTSGTFVAKGYMETAKESKFIESIQFVISDASSTFDNTAVIMGWFIILTVGMAFIWNPTADIIAVNSAVIFVNIIGLVTFAPVYIFGMIAISIFVIILMRT